MIRSLTILLTFIIMFSCNDKKKKTKIFNPLDNKTIESNQINSVCDLVDMINVTLEKVLSIDNQYGDQLERYDMTGEGKSDIPESIFDDLRSLEITLERLEENILNNSKYKTEKLENCNNYKSTKDMYEKLDRIYVFTR